MKIEDIKKYILVLPTNQDRMNNAYHLKSIFPDLIIHYVINSEFDRNAYNIIHDTYPWIDNNIWKDKIPHYKTIQEYSCAYEHYRIIKEAYLLGYDFILVLEDDIEFNDNIDEINKFLENTPEDFDMLKLGYWNHDVKTGIYDNELITYFDKGIYWAESNKHMRYGTCANIYSKSGMKKYLEYQEKTFGEADLWTYIENDDKKYIATKTLFNFNNNLSSSMKRKLEFNNIKKYILLLSNNQKRVDNVNYIKSKITDLEIRYVINSEFDKIGKSSLSPNNSRNNLYNKNIQEYSCALEHYRIIKEAYLLGYNFILVLEDDIGFNDNIDEINKFLEHAPEDFDMLKLAYSDIQPYSFKEDEFSGVQYLKDHPDIYWIDSNTKKRYGAVANIYSRSGMKKYIEYQDNNFDESDSWTYLINDDKKYVSSKPLFNVDNNIQSTLGH